MKILHSLPFATNFFMFMDKLFPHTDAKNVDLKTLRTHGKFRLDKIVDESRPCVIK